MISGKMDGYEEGPQFLHNCRRIMAHYVTIAVTGIIAEIHSKLLDYSETGVVKKKISLDGETSL